MTVEAQLVTVTSVVTSTVEVPQLSSPYCPGGPHWAAGEARTEVARAAATMAYFIFAGVVGGIGFLVVVKRKWWK